MRDSIKKRKSSTISKRLSYKKANQAKNKFKKKFILSADTIVYARKKIIEKTTDINQAKLNLNFCQEEDTEFLQDYFFKNESGLLSICL